MKDTQLDWCAWVEEAEISPHYSTENRQHKLARHREVILEARAVKTTCCVGLHGVLYIMFFPSKQ